MTTRRDIIKGGAGLAAILAAGKAPAYISSMWGARNALMGGKRLPYDAEVEYLESTGTQYINTGFKANTVTTRLEVSIEFTKPTSTQGVFGSRNSSTGDRSSCNAFIIASNIFRPDWAQGRGAAAGSITIAANTIYDLSITEGELVVNGNVHTYSSNANVNQSYDFLLFNFMNAGKPYSGGLYGRIRYAKIYSNSVLVRDFIPVRVGTKGAMYDKRGVGGMNGDGTARNDGLYLNRGTGNFGYGNDK